GGIHTFSESTSLRSIGSGTITATDLNAPAVSGVGSIAVVDTAPPTWPAGAALSATLVSDRGFLLSWPAAQDGNAVAEHRGLRDGAQVDSTAGLSSLQSGLTPDTLYSYSVQAVDESGNVSSGNPTGSIRTLQRDPNVPSWPAGAALSALFTNDTNVSLSWPAA